MQWPIHWPYERFMVRILTIILIVGGVMSWFLFRVTIPFTDDEGNIHEVGSKGVGMCSMAPGIMEAPKGMMYVIPESYVSRFHSAKRQERYCASVVEDAVCAYYGVSL